MNLFPILLLVLVVLILIAILHRYDFEYWKKKGVPFIEPLPFVGNMLDVFLLRTTLGFLLQKYYSELKVSYFGMFVLNKPCFVPKSLQLIQSILATDFNHFCDRTLLADEKLDPLLANALSAINNPEWKQVRSKMTNIFTTGNLRSMWPLSTTVADDMSAYLDKNVDNSIIEAKELCSKYTTDVIASYAFGVSSNCFEHEDAQFRQVGRKMFDFNWKNAFSQASYFMAPSVVKFFRLPFFDPEIASFMRELVRKTIREREETKHSRHDLISIMIKMRNQSRITGDTPFDGDRIVGQSVQFFAAGFETTSSLMAFTLYELCLHQDIQDKLRLEIQTLTSQHGGYTYEAIQEMKYLHMVTLESLRKYPPLPFLDRLCVRDYTIPNTNIVIEKGTSVFVPTLALHYDAEYFPKPDSFDPERFSDENKKFLTRPAYVPFGAGPRACLGDRFGLLSAKLGLARIIMEYYLEPCDTTPVPVEFAKKGFLLAAVAGLPMRFRKI